MSSVSSEQGRCNARPVIVARIGAFDDHALIEEACPSLRLSGSGRFRKSHHSGPRNWGLKWYF